MNINKKTRKQIIELIIIAGIVLWCVFNYQLFFHLVKYIIKLIMPLIVGLGLAFVINVPMKAIETKWFKSNKRKNKKIVRALSLTISLVLIFGILGLVLFLVIPEIIDAISSIIKTISNVDWNKGIALKIEKIYPGAKEYIKNINVSTMATHTLGSPKDIVSMVFAFITNMASKAFLVFIGIIIAIYILIDKENLAVQAKKVLNAFLPEEKVSEIRRIVKLSNKTFSSFITGQCLDAILTGFELFLVLWIIKIPYALILGVLFSVTALIPYIGGFITLAVGMVLVSVTNPINAVWYLIVFFVVQQFDNNFTYPKIVGNAVGLPALWALIAVLVGGSISGFIGMIVSIPLASIIYTLFKDYINNKLDEKSKKLGGKK